MLISASTLTKKINTLVELTYTNNEKPYKYLKQIEAALTKIKSEYGLQCEKAEHVLFMKYYDPYNDLRFVIMRKYHLKFVSNAWLKCFELVAEFNLINKSTGVFKTFSNAEFPGSFILAMNFFVARKRPQLKLDWKAASLTGTATAFKDDYKLYKENPSRWLINEKNNGDVVDINNLLDFKRQLSGGVDLYTSDLGMDVSNNYAGQEEINARAQLGAALSGLMVLHRGGNFLVKQYSFYCALTVDLIIIYSTMFEDFYISKPMTSRPTNSETYLVGLGFIGMTPKVEQMLRERLNNFNFKPLIAANDVPKGPLDEINNFSRLLSERQINYLTESINLYKKNKTNLKRFNDNMGEVKQKTVENWLNRYKL